MIATNPASFRYATCLFAAAVLFLAASPGHADNPLDPTPPPARDNPLDPAPQPARGNPLDEADPVDATDAFTGHFTDGKLTLELSRRGQEYVGFIVRGDQRFPATARRQEGKIVGSFVAGGRDFDFTATTTADGLKLVSGQTTYDLKTPARFQRDQQRTVDPNAIPPGKFKLAFGYAPGTYQGAFQMQADIVATGGGLPIETSESNAYAWLLKVYPQQADGKQRLTFTLKQARLQTRAMGYNMEWDSSRPPDATFQKSFTFALLLNQPIDVMLSTTKRVDEVKGINEAVQRIAAMNEDAGLLAAAQKQAAREAVETALLTHMATLFPEKPVGPGDTWSASVAVNLPAAPGTPLPGKSKLTNVSGRNGIIEFSGTLEPAAGEGVGAFVIKSDSNNVVDLPTGMILASEGTMSIRLVHGRGSHKTTVQGQLQLRRIGD